MPEIRYYTVTQTRKVRVRVTPEKDESYARAALRIAESSFENPGQPQEGMMAGLEGMPKIIATNIERD